jgi:hypothetical protein
MRPAVLVDPLPRPLDEPPGDAFRDVARIDRLHEQPAVADDRTQPARRPQ